MIDENTCILDESLTLTVLDKPDDDFITNQEINHENRIFKKLSKEQKLAYQQLLVRDTFTGTASAV